MSWEGEESTKGLTRRQWVKMGMALGTFGALGGLGGLVTGQLLPPPVQFNGQIRETIAYVRFPTQQWWNAKDGLPVKVADFGLWEGATGVWRGLFQDNQWIPGTGFPVMIIRVKRNATGATVPTDADIASAGAKAPPAGFSLFYDDPKPTSDDPDGTRIITFFDRCVHLCCYPGWHVIKNPPPDYSSYLIRPPTYDNYQLDPIYCVCHGSQYDPLLLTININPKNGTPYVGAERVHGPAPRALPLIPTKVVGGSLVGGMPDPNWYVYC